MTLTFINNSHFFARFELRGLNIWMVWGNPHQNEFNEAMVQVNMIRPLRDWITISTDKGSHVSR